MGTVASSHPSHICVWAKQHKKPKGKPRAQKQRDHGTAAGKRTKCLLSPPGISIMLLPSGVRQRKKRGTQGSQGGPCPSSRSRDCHPLLSVPPPPPLIHVNPPRPSVCLHLAGFCGCAKMWKQTGDVCPPHKDKFEAGLPNRRSRVGPGFIPCHISGAPPRPQVGPTALPPLPVGHERAIRYRWDGWS